MMWLFNVQFCETASGHGMAFPVDNSKLPPFQESFHVVDCIHTAPRLDPTTSTGAHAVNNGSDRTQFRPNHTILGELYAAAFGLSRQFFAHVTFVLSQAVELVQHCGCFDTARLLQR